MNDFLRRILALPEQASTVAAGIDALHYVVIIVTMIGATGVALAAVSFVIRYKDPSPPLTAANRRGTRRFEIGLIAGVLALFFGLWIVGFRQYVELATPPADALDVYVVAKQWMWQFSHPEGQDELSVLTVPAGRPVRLIMTSRDVIHSFYVPDFRIKQDVVPGRYTSVWFEAKRPGRHDVFCAELCGTSHSFMRAAVVVVSGEEYAQWMERSTAESGATSLAERGQETAARQQCLSCHTVDGRRHLAPTWRGLYGSWVELSDGRRVFADEAYLTRSMMNPQEEVVSGFQPIMPTYAGRLSSAEVASLLEYMKVLRSPPDPAIVAAPPLAPSSSVARPSASMTGQKAAAPSPESPASGSREH